MTRALVTQLVEALDELHGNCSGYFSEGNYDMQLAAKALTAAREYLATEPKPTLTEALAQQGIKLRTEFEPKQRDSELATEPSGERAELIEKLRWAGSVGGNQTCIQAADMLEADAQQANKPTGWDSGLSQDYCAEFGQWLASRPGARQQIKAMFDDPEEEDLYALALKADNWGQP